MRIPARDVNAADFAPFGRVHHMAGHGAEADRDGGLVLTQGPGWQDAYTKAPLISTNGSLGMTFGGGSPFVTHQMERHLHTEEALFTAGAAVVLAVAEAGDATFPRAEDVRAFVINPGTAVVLHPGTWHDACRGVDGPTNYYWMASCGGDGGPTWTDVAGGPVHAELQESSQGTQRG